MAHSPVIDLAWRLACMETAASRQPFIEPEHFLEALTKLPQLCSKEGAEILRAEKVDRVLVEPELNLVAEVLSGNGVDPDDLRHELRGRLDRGHHTFEAGETVHRSDRSRAVFARAIRIAQDIRGDLNAGHLFLAILVETESEGCKLLTEMGADLPALSEAMRERLNAAFIVPRSGPYPEDARESAHQGKEPAPPLQNAASKFPKPAVCCDCGNPIPEAERKLRAWINGMFLCGRCKAGVERMADPSSTGTD